MFGVDAVIVIWTAISALTVAFSGVMVFTRSYKLRELRRGEQDWGFKYRVFLAWQDIRRSAIRCLSSLFALSVGAWLWLLNTNHFVEYRDTVPDWPWGLICMAVLTFLNEAFDRWSIYWLRREYAHDTERGQL